MSRQVALFIIPDMENENEKANSALHELLDVEVVEIQCEASMRRMYQCPFIRDEATKLNYYGVDGIETFVSEILPRKKKAQTRARMAHAAA